MLRTKDIMSCLPLLACILGKQYNITVEIGGTTAYTNGKTIHIPSLPETIRKRYGRNYME